MVNKPVILDTNVLMHSIGALDDFKNILLPIEVLEELDKLKEQP